MKFLKR